MTIFICQFPCIGSVIEGSELIDEALFFDLKMVVVSVCFLHYESHIRTEMADAYDYAFIFHPHSGTYNSGRHILFNLYIERHRQEVNGGTDE